jgi:hypothetical protein
MYLDSTESTEDCFSEKEPVWMFFLLGYLVNLRYWGTVLSKRG